MPSLSLILDRDHALHELRGWLLGQDYNRVCRDEIDRHVRATGELSGAVPKWLDAADEATATAVYEESLPAVPITSSDWDIDGTWEEGPAVPDDAILTPPEIDALYEEYEPTEEDRREYAEWLETLEAEADEVEAMRKWYASRPTFEEWLADNGGPA